MHQIWICAAGIGGTTLIGSALGFIIKELPHRWNDMVLGYCAGIMLAASTLGLMVPAFGMTPAWWWVAMGVMAGALFLNVLDLLTPHLHTITGLDPETHKHNKTLNHVLLFVMAVALHKLPEGMAAGISMSAGGGADTDWTVAFGIALQNIPEGMVIIAPLLLAGISAGRTLVLAAAIGLLEVAGVLAGYGLGTASTLFLPVLLGFAGGAMLYVTSDEMIPETHAHGYQKQATYALLIGFMTLLVMESIW